MRQILGVVKHFGVLLEIRVFKRLIIIEKFIWFEFILIKPIKLRVLHIKVLIFSESSVAPFKMVGILIILSRLPSTPLPPSSWGVKLLLPTWVYLKSRFVGFTVWILIVKNFYHFRIYFFVVEFRHLCIKLSIAPLFLR